MTEEQTERLLQQMAQKMADDMMAVLCGSGAFSKPQPTALRLTPSGGFETVDLREDGSVIEPPKRCCYGTVIHAPNCPTWGVST